MSDYLCRIRLDRAPIEVKENGEKLLKADGEVESKRFYLRLSDKERTVNEIVKGEPQEITYVSLENFVKFLYDTTIEENAKTDAILDVLDESGEQVSGGTELTTEVITDLLNRNLIAACPLCSEGRDQKDIIYVTKDMNLVNQYNDTHLVHVDRHIKRCKHVDEAAGTECGKYYCDGGEELDFTTGDGVIHYPKTHEAHNTKEGHYPSEDGTDIEGVKTPKLLSYSQLDAFKSLLGKFNAYVLTLDEKEVKQDYKELHSYLKMYPNNITYVSYKYDLKEENGGFTLRLKVEFSPCKNFLPNRANEYRSLDLLCVNINEFLSYSEVETTEDSLHAVGDLKDLKIEGSIFEEFVYEKPEKNENNEYKYIVRQSKDNIKSVEIDFKVPSTHTKVSRVTVDDVDVNFDEMPLDVEVFAGKDTIVKIYTESISEEEKVTAVHIITFVHHEDSIPETVYNEEREELIIPSVREEDLEDGEIEFASIKIEF